MIKRILVIPDTQVKPDENYDFLSDIGRYAVKIKADYIIHLGDFADMPSLCSHDKPGSKSMEGLRYKKDVQSVLDAQQLLLNPIRKERLRLIAIRRKQWNPKLIMLYGNHENRINRAIQNDPKLEGLISLEDLKYEENGWNTVPFLQPINIEGVAFCHYFISGAMGRPISTARALIAKLHQSCIAGHQQGRDIFYGKRADGKTMTAIIAGSCYEHDEDYLNIQSNNHWRGVYVLNEVEDGQFEDVPISLATLNQMFSKKRKRN
jgi:hypothetical protein